MLRYRMTTLQYQITVIAAIFLMLNNNFLKLIINVLCNRNFRLQSTQKLTKNKISHNKVTIRIIEMLWRIKQDENKLCMLKRRENTQ